MVVRDLNVCIQVPAKKIQILKCYFLSFHESFDF